VIPRQRVPYFSTSAMGFPIHQVSSALTVAYVPVYSDNLIVTK